MNCGAGALDEAEADEGIDVVTNCESGDRDAPTGSVKSNGGAAYTGLTTLTLNLEASDGAGSGIESMRFSMPLSAAKRCADGG